MKNTVLCYFKNLNNQFSDQSKKLISLWHRSWKEHGWNPVVLQKEDSQQNIKYDIKLWSNRSNLIKNSNPPCPFYIQACYERWFAYDDFITRYGICHWADYDVINYSYNYDRTIIDESCKFDPTHSCGILRPTESNKIIDNILKYAYCDVLEFENLEIKDNNDMNLLAKLNILPLRFICSAPLCNRINYHKANLVHFHGGLKNKTIDNINLHNKTRIEIIESLRPYE